MSDKGFLKISNNSNVSMPSVGGIVIHYLQIYLVFL